MKEERQDILNKIMDFSEKLAPRSDSLENGFPGEDFEKAIHDLRVHQKELELQNEALRYSRLELETSRDRYFDLYEQAPAAYLSLNSDGNIIDANLAAGELLNEDRDALIQKQLSDYLAQDSRDDFFFHCRQALELDTRLRCEVRVKRREGHIFHAQLEMAAVKAVDRGGQAQKHLRTALYDISVHKQMEFELERRVEKRASELSKANQELQQQVSYRREVQERLESEHAFRKTIEETIPSGLIVVDTEGQIIYVNQAFCKMVGWTAVELIGSRPPYKYWPPEESEERTRSFLKNLSETDSPYEVERRFLRNDGEIFWGLLFSTQFSNSKGRIIGRLSSIININARKKAQEALKNSEERLRDLSVKLIQVQEKERKRISQELHDSIGAGLSAIKFSLEKKISDMGERPKEGPALEDIVTRLQNIIVETQRISRNLHPSILDDLGISAAIRSLCREYQEVYTDIRVHQEVEVDEEKLTENIKILLYRLMQESLNNIAKHSGADEVHLSLKMTDNWIEISVEDNGKGFDLNGLNKNRDARMGGLGLRGMKERTELSGGSFEIRTSPGHGTMIRARWRQ